MKSFVRRIAAGAVLLGAALVLARGLQLTAYVPPTSDAYLWGAFHVHSTRSDGLGSYAEIARQARQARVAFLLMSDHGAPHASSARVETVDGVRFVGGSEVGLPEGRLIVSRLEAMPRYKLPPYPPDAVRDVHEFGGMAVLAYPEDPRYGWSYWGEDLRPDGIEVINVTSYLRAAPVWRALSWAVFSLFNRHYAVHVLESPTLALARWDDLLRRGDVAAFYAANAHGGFRLGERRGVPVPSYRAVLGLVGLGVDRRHRAYPEEAIRQGDFFSVVRGAGEPDRFRFMRAPDGRIEVTVSADATLVPRVVLRRDGQVVAETRGGSLGHDPAAGVYRAEVYLEDHPLLAPDVPWILSNAIRIGVPEPPAAETPVDCARRTALALDEFRVESDADSHASTEVDASGALVLSYSLSRATPEAPERWVALARRQPLALAAASGLYVEARARRPMRYRLKVGTTSGFYHASVLIRETGRVAVPWEQFYRLGVDAAREPVPLHEVEGLFLEVTDSTARTGFDATLVVDGIGLCRPA